MWVQIPPGASFFNFEEKNMKKLPKRIKEKFIVDEYSGMASAAISLQKPGYTFEKMERKSKNVTITFCRIDE